MHSFDDIAAFVCEYAGVNRAYVTEATSLQDDIGLYGIDIDVLMLEYSKRFGVDVSGYHCHWYFHTCEEGFGIGAFFFPSARYARKSNPHYRGIVARVRESRSMGRGVPEA